RLFQHLYGNDRRQRRDAVDAGAEEAVAQDSARHVRTVGVLVVLPLVRQIGHVPVAGGSAAAERSRVLRVDALLGEILPPRIEQPCIKHADVHAAAVEGDGSVVVGARHQVCHVDGVQVPRVPPSTKSLTLTASTGAPLRSASGFAATTNGRAWIAASCPALARISRAL